MALAVLMTMMQVRIVDVLVSCRFVPVPMRMRLRRGLVVGVLMMFVMDMTVFVLDRFVRMFVAVPLGQMKPEAERHKRAGGEQLMRDRLA